LLSVRSSEHARASDSARHIGIVVCRWSQSISANSTLAVAVSTGKRYIVAPTTRPSHDGQQHGYYRIRRIASILISIRSRFAVIVRGLCDGELSSRHA
jgi:hypothetical protein